MSKVIKFAPQATDRVRFHTREPITDPNSIPTLPDWAEKYAGEILGVCYLVAVLIGYLAFAPPAHPQTLSDFDRFQLGVSITPPPPGPDIRAFPVDPNKKFTGYSWDYEQQQEKERTKPKGPGTWKTKEGKPVSAPQNLMVIPKVFSWDDPLPE